MISINSSLREYVKLRRQPLLFSLIILICGLIYISQYWSPSSYGIVLTQLGVQDSGPVFGRTRPIRSDEWAVVTPLTQATVNNGFERVNKTSFYKEDLRINYGLPIFDWGLIFKPTMWAYLAVEPARAYSIHWFAVFALFLVGYALLFKRLGLGSSASVLLAVGLYYTGFAQFWWNEKGPILAFFPWTIWVLLSSKPLALRLMLFYWLGVSWLLTNFYPPLFLSLSFVGAILLLAFGRDWLDWRRFLALVVTTAFAGGTAALYLRDYLRLTATTIYPGQRNSSGGDVLWTEWLSQFFPFSTFDGKFGSVIGLNICEIGNVGAAFFLMMICFIDWHSVRTSKLNQVQKRQFLIMGIGLLLMNAWMMLPIPSWVGIPFLWNHVPPGRMMYASGLLLLLGVALLGNTASFVISPTRVRIYLSIVVVGWVVLKGIGFGDATTPGVIVKRLNDLIVVPVLLSAIALAKRFGWRPYTTMLSASAVSGVLALIYFNPIQSALPIFSRHETPATRAIDAQVQVDNGEKMLAMSGVAGAVLNGLGYASVSHVTAVPALAFWRMRYPVMPQSEFLNIFNRYSHIQLADNLKPLTPQSDVVRVPIHDFWPNRVEVPAPSEGASEPLWLRQGQVVNGEIVIGRTGEFDKIAMLIGTGKERSDGILQIRVCVKSGEDCITGSGPLTGAMDNSFFTVKLRRSLKITESNEPLRYEIRLISGKNPVALWTQKTVISDASLFHMDGVVDAVSPKFQIDLH